MFCGTGYFVLLQVITNDEVTMKNDFVNQLLSVSKLIRGQKESEFLRRQRGPLRGNSCGALRQQGLKPIKYTSAERSAPLTTSAFNPLGQYTSSMPAVRPTVT